MRTNEELKMLQALPLEVKIEKSKQRIREWVDEYGVDGCYISFSGGKDSTVLMDIIRNKMGLDVPALFVDVPTQYPELKQFAKTYTNVEIVKPQISFVEVCSKYGFPLISKETSLFIHQMQLPPTEKNAKNRNLRLNGVRSDGQKVRTGAIPKKWQYLINAPFMINNACCDVMKKKPAHEYAKRTNRFPITAQMADESRVRRQKWLQFGCNAFDKKEPMSNPLSFWTEQDILAYIYIYSDDMIAFRTHDFENLNREIDMREETANNREWLYPICSVYGNVIEDFDAEEQIDGQLSIFNADKILKTTGCKRTGCMLCGYGCHLEKNPNRFELLAQTHPKMIKLLDLCKNNGFSFREAIEWANTNGELNIKLPPKGDE